MKKVFADIEKNILHIKFVGFISAETMEKIEKEIIKEIPKLAPGFDIINDMSNFTIANTDALKIAQRLLEKLKNIGVRKSIRVIGSSQNAVVQSAAITKNVEGYQVDYVPTMEEAYKLLNK